MEANYAKSNEVEKQDTESEKNDSKNNDEVQSVDDILRDMGSEYAEKEIVEVLSKT